MVVPFIIKKTCKEYATERSLFWRYINLQNKDVQMHGRSNTKWSPVLFPRLKVPDIAQSSKDLTELSITLWSESSKVTISRNPTLTKPCCACWGYILQDSGLNEKGQRQQRARESGSKRPGSWLRPLLPKGKTVQHVRELLGYLFSRYQMRLLQ